MNTREEVLEFLRVGTGSPNGISGYLTMASCPRKWHLDRAAKAAGEFSFSESRDVGTLFHYLAACYHEGRSAELPDLAGGGDVDQLGVIVAEAQRTFKEYARRVPVDGWGRVVGAEVPLALHRGDMREPVTGQADLIVELRDPQIHDTMARCKMQLEPGYYIVDHKTHTRIDNQQALKDSISLQALVYGMCGQRLYREEYKGMLFSHIVRHQKWRDDSFLTTYVEPPTQADAERLWRFIYRCERLSLTPECNEAACVGQYGICQHRITGACTLL